MIVKFFNTGLSTGETPVNYLLSLRDHAGNFRGHIPEVLEGSPRLTIEVINNICRKHKYASGCLAFRAEEKPTKAELLAIIDRFKTVATSGLSADQFNCLFVLHKDKENTGTVKAGFHVHFLLPMTLLSGTSISGKNLAGKRWNPHPPGQQSIETYSLFADVINYEHGWERVNQNSFRVNLDSFWRKAGNASHTKKAEMLRRELSKAIKSKVIKSREDLCHFLDDTLGLTITRKSASSISIKFPGSAKAIRLKGPMFESDVDYATLLAEASQNLGMKTFTPVEYKQAKIRLNSLLSQRASYITGDKTTSTTKKITIRKDYQYGRLEKRFGGNEKRFGGNENSNKSTGWSNALSDPENGMVRSLLQSSERQWGHGDERSSEASPSGPEKAQERIQHASNASEVARGTRRQWLAGQFGKSFANNIDQKIWELAVQLNECDPCSDTAVAITAQLNYLQGERERQKNTPKPRRK